MDSKKRKTHDCGPECCCDSDESRTLKLGQKNGNITGYMKTHTRRGIIFHGTIIHSLALNTLEIREKAYLGVEVRAQNHGETNPDPSVIDQYKFWKSVDNTPSTAIIQFLVDDKGDVPQEEIWANAEVVELGEQFLCPGFVDTHTHAPQYRFAGCGRIPLLQWLQKYTFPTEDKFKNLDFAKRAYPKAVQRHVQAGTTTCCYFATINTPASLVLCDAITAVGQRAFVGKVCMDRNSPDYYVETTQESLRDSEAYIKEVNARDNHLLKPIVTPRFVPSCSSALMHGLAAQAKKYDCNIQSHLSENKEEIAWVASLHPDSKSYTEVYDQHGLLTDKTVMAHCVHLSDEEIALLKDRKAGISHCPNSNFSLYSGVMDTRKVLDSGVKVGLGTDVAGGYSVSMLDAMRLTMVASAATSFKQSADAEGKAASATSTADEGAQTAAPEARPNINYKEAFFLGTQGGAEVLALGDKVGNFEVGKEFDGLVINPHVPDSPFDVYDADTVDDIFQKFIFCGDDRNIVEVYVAGDRILKRPLKEAASISMRGQI